MTAFVDAPALVALAEAYAGQPVFLVRFQDIDCRESFDGVWACASLLHLPGAELPDALGRLAAALVPGGVMYASFKYGHGEREDLGRHFTDMDEAGLLSCLTASPVCTRLMSGSPLINVLAA